MGRTFKTLIPKTLEFLSLHLRVPTSCLAEVQPGNQTAVDSRLVEPFRPGTRHFTPVLGWERSENTSN